MCKPKRVFVIVPLACMLALCGCLHWKSDFSDWSAAPVVEDPEALVAHANRLMEQADGRENLLAAINAFQAVLRVEPSNYTALYEVSNGYLLLGDAYTEQRREKLRHFRLALLYSERAMLTNAAFKERIEAGAPVWLAVDALTTREMEAMLFWSTALFYYYKDGFGPIRQTINYRWITRARRVLGRMAELDPDWGGGAVHFSLGLYYLAIPVRVGGDRELSAAYFARAIEAGPDRLLNRWGRARYFHVKMQNPDLFVEDLTWILEQDLAAVRGSRAWNIYFFRSAREMLDRVDHFFE